METTHLQKVAHFGMPRALPGFTASAEGREVKEKERRNPDAPL